ncbi:DKNYY domain-containing protein [Soonwooa sp.]|uniref:DKNYY domain-containing protein n=1 Tax=Soonwooa sp. TaxID=1938592 RepID=UPI002620F0B3|nr:DKNYY domain-containing protein [Soonwooa sp.]
MKSLKFLFLVLIVGCSKKQGDDSISLSKPKDTKLKTNPVEYALADSLALMHIKNQFYKDKTGVLFEKTFAQKEVNGKLQDVEYFNAVISQDIDAYSFEQIGDSWYAKDKNNVYYYRPTSGGMQISKIENADVNSFQVLNKHYRYAIDKNKFYQDASSINAFAPKSTTQIKDQQGKILALKSPDQYLVLEK